MFADKTVATVLATKDYEKFKSLAGNRAVNPVHVKRLSNSFKEDYLMSPIIVNERFEIIDGQHRFTAAKTEGLEIRYIIAPGYSLLQVQRLNTGTSNWKKSDYLDSYADLGISAYVKMRKFMEDFPELGISACECLLTQNVGGANNRKDENKNKVRDFQTGSLQIADLDFAYEAADKVMKIAPNYDGYKRATFVRAISTLMTKPVFDVDYFIEKLSRYSSMFSHQQSVSEYIALIEEVYNYRKRDKDNLRF